MEKRALLAIVISMAILLLTQPLLVKYFPQQKQQQKTPAADITPHTAAPSDIQKVEQQIQPVKPAAEKEIFFENEDYRAILSNVGGGIKSITLKKHLDSNGKPIVLFDEPNPLDATFVVSGLEPGIDKAIFSYSARPDSVIFSVKSPSGLSIEKEVVFQEGKYAIQLRQTLTNYSNQSRIFKYSIVGGSGLTDLSAQDGMYAELVKQIDGKITNVNAKSIKNPVSWEGMQVNWISLKARYFSLIMKPPLSFKTVYSNMLPDKRLQSHIGSADFTITPNSSVTHDFILYAGPNEHDKMQSLKLGIEDSLYLGFTGSIGRILFVILKYIHVVVRNWGLAIIFLTVIINILMFPLTFKGIKAMKQMQALQPKIEALRKAHKGDSQKLNKEVMELYRKYKINPMGGCLPLILQMPVFFALYQVLMRSIELRGASFLWIKDLSHPDRLVIFKDSIPLLGNELNILPLLMAIAMFFQQKLSTPPQTGSNDQMVQQQKMMAVMMPILFGFMFYHLPSGLVMYWLTNTLLTLSEQELFLKKQMFHVEHSED